MAMHQNVLMGLQRARGRPLLVRKAIDTILVTLTQTPPSSRFRQVAQVKD